jgi:hypothetical protein
MNHSVKREKAQRERERAMKGRGAKENIAHHLYIKARCKNALNGTTGKSADQYSTPHQGA